MSNPPSVRNLIGNMSTSSSDGNGIWVSVDHSIPNSASKEPPSSPRLIVVFDNIDSRYHDQVFNYDRRAGKKRKKKKKKNSGGAFFSSEPAKHIVSGIGIIEILIEV